MSYTGNMSSVLLKATILSSQNRLEALDMLMLSKDPQVAMAALCSYLRQHNKSDMYPRLQALVQDASSELTASLFNSPIKRVSKESRDFVSLQLISSLRKIIIDIQRHSGIGCSSLESFYESGAYTIKLAHQLITKELRQEELSNLGKILLLREKLADLEKEDSFLFPYMISLDYLHQIHEYDNAYQNLTSNLEVVSLS